MLKTQLCIVTLKPKHSVLTMGFSNKDEHQHHVDYEADMYTGITTFHGLVRIYNSRNWLVRYFA